MEQTHEEPEQKKPCSTLPGPERLTIPCFDQRGSIDSTALSDVPSEVIIKSRIRQGSVLSACKGLLVEYSKSTTIHGVRYIFEIHRPFYEKICWIASTFISISFAMSLIRNTCLKWQESPVILGFDETLVPVHQIPFPTITICPETKMERNIFDFSIVSRLMWKDYKNGNKSEINNEDLTRMAAALHICDIDVTERFIPIIKKFQPPPVNVSDTLINMSLSFDDMAPICKWNGRFFRCEKIFAFVATDEGICYQFNGLRPKDIYRDENFIDYKDPDIVNFDNYFETELPKWNTITGNWSLETGYVNQSQNAYPQRTIFSSARNGFFAFLQGLQHNFDYDCRSVRQGYKVFLNSPESVPLTTDNYINVPHGNDVSVSVLPNYVVSTDNLHQISPEKRPCYFDDERSLRFFRSYSKNNCQVECLANYTISKCNCVKFWMPKPLGTPVCGLDDIACYTAAQDELDDLLLNEIAQLSIDPNTKRSCNCLPACTSLEYNFEITRARYDIAKMFKALREDFEYSDFTGSRLSIYFRENQFTAVKRTFGADFLFGISTLISNCGGIFGLFMGISSLSFLEFFYFFCMRICRSCRDRRKHKILQRKENKI